METKEPFTNISKWLTKNGESRIIKWNNSVKINAKGEIENTFSIGVDITDRKLAETELKNTNRDLELYASILRHDLGNDLQVIFSTNEVAEMLTPKGSELIEFIEANKAAADRMSRLLDVFGRPEKEAEKTIVSLIENISIQARKAHKNLTIRVKYPKTMKGTRIAGGRLLHTVFVNLFRNAAQYAGPKPTVNVKLSQDGERVRIDVVDDGPGIPKKLHAKLFERGSSAKESGLGLNLCKRVLEAYGGSIELVKSPPGQGASFRVSLLKEESQLSKD